MRVRQLGTGTPEIAIIAGIHGDEPCGVKAIDRLVAEAPTVDRPVKLIVANEAALDRGVRFIDADLNRPIDPDHEGDAHEWHLANRLAVELDGCTAISLHSTQSIPEPFALISDLKRPIVDLCQSLGVIAVASLPALVGRSYAENARILEVESGLQGTPEAVEQAYRLSRAFLELQGALPGTRPQRPVPLFEGLYPLEKPPATEYEVYVDNFTEVAAGTTYASADGEPFVAERDFCPVLLSAYGHPDVFGWAADRIGTLEVSKSRD